MPELENVTGTAYIIAEFRGRARGRAHKIYRAADSS